MFKELLGFPPLEFFNAVETITTEGKTKIHNVLYFTNNTKDKIPVEGYHFVASLKGRNKPLIATNGFHFSSVVIEPMAVKTTSYF